MTLVMMTAVSGPCNSFYCLGNFKNIYGDDDDDDSTINIVVVIIIAMIIRVYNSSTLCQLLPAT